MGQYKSNRLNQEQILEDDNILIAKRLRRIRQKYRYSIRGVEEKWGSEYLKQLNFEGDLRNLELAIESLPAKKKALLLLSVNNMMGIIAVAGEHSESAYAWGLVKAKMDATMSAVRKPKAIKSGKLVEIIQRLAKARLDVAKKGQRSTYAIACHINKRPNADIKSPEYESPENKSPFEKECEQAGITPIQNKAIAERIKKLRDSGVIPA
jgi:hypothetical protein